MAWKVTMSNMLKKIEEKNGQNKCKDRVLK